MRQRGLTCGCKGLGCQQGSKALAAGLSQPDGSPSTLSPRTRSSEVRTGTYLTPFILDANQENERAQEKADAQVQVHHGPGALDGLHQQEGQDTQQQADEGE